MRELSYVHSQLSYQPVISFLHHVVEVVCQSQNNPGLFHIASQRDSPQLKRQDNDEYSFNYSSLFISWSDELIWFWFYKQRGKNKMTVVRCRVIRTLDCFLAPFAAGLLIPTSPYKPPCHVDCGKSKLTWRHRTPTTFLLQSLKAKTFLRTF